MASSHVLPSSFVTLMRPLFVPTQIVPLATVDAEIVSIAPAGGVPGTGVAVSGGGVTPFA